MQSLKQLYGQKLGASDGEIGHVKDFYFDDQNWAVRYLVVDTGSWLPGRQVLISPHAFDRLHQAGKLLPVKLSRKQIEGSPSIETHKPVTRQFEEEYHQYFGWPYYWQGGGLWGTSAFPIFELPIAPSAAERAQTNGPQSESADVHLRSAQGMTGYHIKKSEEAIGQIFDFMMDEKSWTIRQLVIKTGHWLSGREVQIPTDHVGRISFDESTVFVSLDKEAIGSIPAHHP